ncbi:MAG: hypothetical protein AAGA81_16995 [Acidobacteriota bacterium]
MRSTRATAADRQSLQSHISLAARVLDNRGAVEIRVPGLDGAFLLDVRTYSRRPKSFSLRASSGYLGREAVEKISEYLDSAELSHLRRMTRKRNLVRDVRMIWRADEESAPAAATRALARYCDALGLPCDGPFRLSYRGRRDPTFLPRDGDPRSPLDNPLRRLVSSVRAQLFRGVGR